MKHNIQNIFVRFVRCGLVKAYAKPRPLASNPSKHTVHDPSTSFTAIYLLAVWTESTTNLNAVRCSFKKIKGNVQRLSLVEIRSTPWRRARNVPEKHACSTFSLDISEWTTSHSSYPRFVTKLGVFQSRFWKVRNGPTDPDTRRYTVIPLPLGHKVDFD
jgi:hypothetical protein